MKEERRKLKEVPYQFRKDIIPINPSKDLVIAMSTSPEFMRTNFNNNNGNHERINMNYNHSRLNK